MPSVIMMDSSHSSTCLQVKVFVELTELCHEELGVYLLEVLSVQHIFSQIKIKVDDEDKVTVVEFKYPGGIVHYLP